MRNIADLVGRIIESSHPDPDKRRRARILNIILLSSFVISILAFLFALGAEIAEQEPQEEALLIYVPSSILAACIVLIYFVNRRSPSLASAAFLVILVALLSVSDEREQIAGGRSQLFLALPVIMAASVLPAWCTFLFAGLVSFVISLIGFSIGMQFTPFATFAFFVIALVSYLGASQLEQALARLRHINEELDQRVADRTHELVDANAQLANANERLRELDKLKSRFLSMVSHELRTPLSAIQGFAEILLAEIYGPVTPGQRNALDRITNNAIRLLNLVSDLLDRARIEAGQLEIHPHPFSPFELVQDVYSTLGVIAESKGLMLVAEVDPDLPSQILGDEARLRQVLVNLVNNALKFTQAGAVTIKLARYDGAIDGNPVITPHWSMAVTDTGPGIAPEHQEAIFRPFRRVDDSSTRREIGAGLGLSIVKDLVELMNGNITLISEVGRGSTFTIILPLLSSTEGNHG